MSSVPDSSGSGSEASLCEAILAATPQEALTISQVLEREGFHAWLVGGCVRDLIRLWEGRPRASLPADFDLCTDARPEVVARLFRRVIPTGMAHGTVTVVLGRRHFEVTTLRGERGYSDGRHPDEVFFVSDLELDLARRDFTVNAMAFDLQQPKVSDPFHGREDLERGLLRAVGDPLERFSEDGLRVLRCARFSATLGLEVEPNTRAAMRPSLGSFAKVAGERVREEWLKALGSTAPSRAFRLLRSEGLLAVTCPGLFPEDSAPLDAAYDATCARLDRAGPEPLFRLALLLVCAARSAAEARELTLELAQRLKLSGAEKTRLLRLAEPAADLAHLPLDDLDAPALRRLMRSIGADYLLEVAALAREACEPASEQHPRLVVLQERMEEELARKPPLSLRDLRVSGGELISELGMQPGPAVGQLLERLLEATLDDPAQNEKERLLSLARQLK